MVEIVGRAEELGFIDALLDRTDGAAAGFVLEGEAGIGKSTLWRAGVDAARERGLRVLEASPSESERGFAYAGLTDLLEPALDDVLPALAAPRRRALEVALALEDEPEAPVDPRTLAIAVRNALEVLAAARRVLVAIDDVQWLDASSAGPLAFALRRLRDENVCVLLARRLGDPPADGELDYALPAGRVERVRVGPLSLGATQRLVQIRLGTTFARPTLLRVHDAAGGNPFYALELARAVNERGGVGNPTQPLPVPDTLEDLVRARLAGLPEEARDALVLAAAVGRATPELLRAAGVRDGALDAAQDARVVEVDGVVRFTHPLLASVLIHGIPARERRRAHARLAEVVRDPIARARHLALATDGADAAAAATLERAAEHASARGAVGSAAELHEHALRLTPLDAAEDRHRRTVAAAHAHLAAGEGERARALANELERRTAGGPRRGEVLLLLGRVDSVDLQRAIALRREALEHVAGRPDLEAEIHQSLSLYVRFSDGLPAAEEHARHAVELAKRIGDDALRSGALASLALLRFNGGKADSLRLSEEAHRLAVRTGHRQRLLDASFCLAHVRVWSMELDEARDLLEELDGEWGQSDELVAANASWYRSLVEICAGRWAVASEYAERSRGLYALYSLEDAQDPTTFYPDALIAAHRGDLARARELATHGARLAEQQGALLPGLEGTVATAELWSGDAASALEWFAVADRKAKQSGFVEPGMCPWRPYYIEALLEVGRTDDAQRVLDELEVPAKRLRRTWWLAHATRCRGLLAATQGQVDEAAALLQDAVAQHERAGDVFSRARALLALGIVLRRTRKKRAARESIETALAAFEELGANGWAEKTRAELGRFSGRRREEGLTAAEQRVAALVAEGRTNRQVAEALFLGERTVESHLTRVYDKLGVRSRAELASKFGGSHDFNGVTPS